MNNILIYFRVKHCTDANHGLKKKVDKLNDDNKSLLLQLKQLQAIVAASVKTSRTAQKGTCLAVRMFVCFTLLTNPVLLLRDFHFDMRNNY